MTFSEKIFNLRKARGMNQNKVAKQLGVSRQSMYKWESGACMPELEKIKKMAEIYDVTYDYLLDDNIEIIGESSPDQTNQSSQDGFNLSSNNDAPKNNKKLKVLFIITSFIIVILATLLTIICINNCSEVPNQPESPEKTVHLPSHELVLAIEYSKVTCEENGRALMYCKESNCDHVEVVVTKATGHEFDSNRKCKTCNYIYGSYGIMYATDDGKTYYVKSVGKCREENIVISNKCNGRDVVAISANAFKDNAIISTVYIPGTVKTIEKNAFYGCVNLRRVNFEEGLKSIEQSAFYNCSLTELTFPNSLETIEENAFAINYDITYLSFGANLKYIGNNAFSKCKIELVTYSGTKEWLYDDRFKELNAFNLKNLTGVWKANE